MYESFRYNTCKLVSYAVFESVWFAMAPLVNKTYFYSILLLLLVFFFCHQWLYIVYMYTHAHALYA